MSCRQVKPNFRFLIIPILFYYSIFSPFLSGSVIFVVRFSARIFFFPARSVWFYLASHSHVSLLCFSFSIPFFLYSYFRRPDIFNVLSRGQGLVSRTDCVSANPNGILFTCSPDDWTALLNRHPIEDIHVFLPFFALLSREEAYIFEMLHSNH